MIEEYIQRLKKGDYTSLDEIYKLTNKQVYALCFSYMHEYYDAEDAMMETYLNIRKYINSYKDNTNPLGWITTIAKNICKSKLIKKKKVVSVDNFYDSIDYKQPTNTYSKEARKILDIAKAILKQKELYIVLEHILNETSLVDIAKRLNANESTIRWTYNNALNKIRKRLGKES